MDEKKRAKLLEVRKRNQSLLNQTLVSSSSYALNKPLEVLIELTTHCNISCIFCAREHHPGYLSRELVGNMPMELVDKLSGVLETCQSVSPQGFGEPFLHRDFLPIIEKVKRSGAEVMFNTNVTMLGEEEARRLIAAGVDQVTLSIDGATKETFERLRKGARFDTIVRNARRLNEIKKACGSKLPVVLIEFIAMKSNIHELPRMVDLASTLGVFAIYLEPLVPHGGDLEDERLEGYDEEPYRSIVAAARARAREVGVELQGRGISSDFNPLGGNTPIAQAGDRLEQRPKDTPGPPNVVTAAREVEAAVPEHGTVVAEPIDSRVPASADAVDAPQSTGGHERPTGDVEGSITLLCGEPFYHIFVERDGRVRTCCYGLHDLGNLGRQSIEEIWNGPAFRALRQAMRTGLVPSECHQCVRMGRIPPMRYKSRRIEVTPPDVTYLEASIGNLVSEMQAIDQIGRCFVLELERARLLGDGTLEVTVHGSLSLGSPAFVETSVGFDAVPANGAGVSPLIPPVSVDIPGTLTATRTVRIPIKVASFMYAEPWSVRVTVLKRSSGDLLKWAETPVSVPGGPA